VFATSKCQSASLAVVSHTFRVPVPAAKPQRCGRAGEHVLAVPDDTILPQDETLHASATRVENSSSATSEVRPSEIDPLYLLACQVEWEQREEPSAAWELLAAAQSTNSDTRAHARALLASSHHLGGIAMAARPLCFGKFRRDSDGETDMKAPYGLNIIEDCTECSTAHPDFFCAFSPSVLSFLSQFSHKSTLPAGAILFVEGQSPRGMFILCSGRVNLSTTSREGKILILKTAEAGEPWD